MSRTFAEAAAELNLRESWMRKHIKSLSHHKYGNHVRFEDDDMDAIRAKHRQQPQTGEGASLYLVRAAAEKRLAERRTNSQRKAA